MGVDRYRVVAIVVVGAGLMWLMVAVIGWAGTGIPYASPTSVTQAGEDFMAVAKSGETSRLPSLASSVTGVRAVASRVHTALTAGGCEISATRVDRIRADDRYVVYLTCITSGAAVVSVLTRHDTGEIVSAAYDRRRSRS
jgi:hypothetical protein